MTKVLVTGASGFLGRHLVRRLSERGYQVVAPTHAECDLRELEETRDTFARSGAEVIIHLAANVGGIGYDAAFPASILVDNLQMVSSVLDAARQLDGVKVVLPIAACGYPGEATGALREDQFLEGRPHHTVEMYAASRRALMLGHQYFRAQYGFNSIALILTNLYGPGDRYHHDESHVAAALVRKFHEATVEGAPAVEVWGTGAPVREFLYVEDAADALIHAMEHYDGELPVNLGTGNGTSIRELAELMQDLTGYQGRIDWNTAKPDGALYKVLDVTRMRDVLGWTPPTDVREGFGRTLQWYTAHRDEANRYSKGEGVPRS